jgi:hypothetical protein
MKDNQYVNGKIDAVQVVPSVTDSDGRISATSWLRRYGRSSRSWKSMWMKLLRILVECENRDSLQTIKMERGLRWIDFSLDICIAWDMDMGMRNRVIMLIACGFE